MNEHQFIMSGLTMEQRRKNAEFFKSILDFPLDVGEFSINIESLCQFLIITEPPEGSKLKTILWKCREERALASFFPDHRVKFNEKLFVFQFKPIKKDREKTSLWYKRIVWIVTPLLMLNVGPYFYLDAPWHLVVSLSLLSIGTGILISIAVIK